MYQFCLTSLVHLNTNTFVNDALLFIHLSHRLLRILCCTHISFRGHTLFFLMLPIRPVGELEHHHILYQAIDHSTFYDFIW